jgi:hypothetical protein
MTLPTRLLASLASCVPLTDAQLDKLEPENSNQRRVREADERLRREYEDYLNDGEMQRVLLGGVTLAERGAK